MSFKRGDVVTFTDEDKGLVLEALLFEGAEYLYVNEILPDESDMTDKYKVLVANYEDGTLEKVIDVDILSKILPIFQEKLQQY